MEPLTEYSFLLKDVYFYSGSFNLNPNKSFNVLVTD